MRGETFWHLNPGPAEYDSRGDLQDLAAGEGVAEAVDGEIAKAAHAGCVVGPFPGREVLVARQEDLARIGVTPLLVRLMNLASGTARTPMVCTLSKDRIRRSDGQRKARAMWVHRLRVLQEMRRDPMSVAEHSRISPSRMRCSIWLSGSGGWLINRSSLMVMIAPPRLSKLHRNPIFRRWFRLGGVSRPE